MQPHIAVRILENPKHSPKDVELHSLEKQMIAYLNDGAIQSGLEIALETTDGFLEKPTLTHSWAIYFYMYLRRKSKAMKMIEQGFRRGAWWSPKYLRSELKELEDNPAFPKILKMGEERFNEVKNCARMDTNM